MRLDRRLVLTVAAAVVVVILIVVVVMSRSDSSKPESSSSASSASVSSTSTTVKGSATTSTSIPEGPYTTPDMPVAVSVSGTKGLSSGSTVTVHAAPQGGSQMFGVEARLCRGDVAIVSDGDFLPTRGGNCIVNPLQPGTDAKKLVAGAPPYGGLDLTFVVGTGTDTFLTQFDGTKSVTCDATHPCQIALKLQYPNGFGFQGVPVTFG